MIGAFSLVALLAVANVAGPEIPAKLHGTWDAGVEACRAEYSDMRMTITDEKIGYWESNGQPTQIYAAGSDDIWIDLAMSGEEQTWKSKLRLVLSGSADILFVEDIAVPEHDYFKTTWFYHRCSDGVANREKNAKN